MSAAARVRRAVAAAVRATAAGAAAAVSLALAGCDGRAPPTREPLTGGDAAAGARLIGRYGCGACHTIPGIRAADGLVGPPLSDLRERTYVAGVLPNTPDNMVAWIVDPRAHSPRTAMPKVGATPAEARDIAAYLYSR